MLLINFYSFRYLTYDVALKNKEIPIRNIVTNIMPKLEDVEINDRIIVCVDKKIRQLTKKGKGADSSKNL